MIINCDGIVHNPLGGASYIFQDNIVNYLLKKNTKDNIIISIGAQPNSSPHFGTLVVFSTAFSLAKKIQNKDSSKKAMILFEVIDTAPGETIMIKGIKYQKSLKNSGLLNKNIDEYIEILNYFKKITSIDYKIRYQSEFNKQSYIYPIVKKIIKKRKILAPIMDPKYNNLRIRIACPKCGLSDKNSVNTQFKNNTIISYCPNHGKYKINIKKETHKLEYNTPLRNLIRAIAYGKHNKDSNNDDQIIRITGSDYAGFYQEELLYKPASILKYPMSLLPTILYVPLIVDWSGAKISKSLYIKKNAYRDLPQFLINYQKMKKYYGIKGLEIINKITNEWIEKPYLLFRNYSIYYFEKEFDKHG